jgi:hypothetical protein
MFMYMEMALDLAGCCVAGVVEMTCATLPAAAFRLCSSGMYLGSSVNRLIKGEEEEEEEEAEVIEAVEVADAEFRAIVEDGNRRGDIGGRKAWRREEGAKAMNRKRSWMRDIVV